MTITSVTHWKGGKHDDMLQAARKAKAIHEKHGADDFRLGKAHAGPNAGQWVAVSYFRNWESYGKVQEALARDSEYQALLAQVGSMAELTARSLVVGIDL